MTSKPTPGSAENSGLDSKSPEHSRAATLPATTVPVALSRRRFAHLSAGSVAIAAGAKSAQGATHEEFKLNYLVGGCMYGYMYIGEILPEVHKTGAGAIDIWPKPHGNQRVQLTDVGEEKFVELLSRHDVTVGCITQYPLGPFGLQEEMRLAARLKCRTLVTGGAGPVGLRGAELKAAVREFVEQMKPHLAVAEETDVAIAIENHGNNLIESPDSLKWLAEFSPSPRLGIAFAPYHLPQDPLLLAQLLKDLGPATKVFYAWQHGHGSTQRLPKEEELLQMPGRGELDFGPMLAALAEFNYAGWTEIFMHPVPRGIPILETAAAVTAEINRAREYLTSKLPSLS